MLGKWATVVLLSMTPALILGQSAAAGAGIAWHLPALPLVFVIAIAGAIEGVLVAWVGGASTRVGFVHRWCERMRTPRAMKLASTWGTWGGMLFGVALVGQEPILVALRWLGVDLRKLVLPIVVSNVLFAAVYYGMTRLGADQLARALH